MSMLNFYGLDGDMLKVEIKRVEERAPLMAQNLVERIQLLAKARSHGARFIMTHCKQITHNDFLGLQSFRNRRQK